MSRSLIPASVAARINTVLKPNAFATQKAVGNVQSITFHREDPNTGADRAIGPFEVLIKLPGIGGAPVAGGPAGTAVSFVGYQGEFRIERGVIPAFTVHREDRFCLSNGSCGRLISEPVDAAAYTRVPFVIER